MREVDLPVVGSGAVGISAALDRRGRAIQGLYTTGNDKTSIMGGAHPEAGITIGPALTFGYIAARHAVAAGR